LIAKILVQNLRVITLFVLFFSEEKKELSRKLKSTKLRKIAATHVKEIDLNI